jgi:sialate O-acetylesterase
MDSVIKMNSLANNQHNSSPVKNDKGLNGAKTWYDTAFIPRNWHHFWLPGYWADQGVKNLNGVVWFRKEIILPASAQGQPAKLFLGRIVDADQTYVNGQSVGNITYKYPPRRYNVPAGLLKPGKNVIIVRVLNTSGKGGFVPDKPYHLNIGKEVIDLRGEWVYQVGQVFSPADTFTPPVFTAQNEPAGLYNTMVASVINYTIKGLLWYQGESNVDKAAEYGRLLAALIADWRSRWKQGDVPFIYAQLPNFNEVEYLPAESDWAMLREGQLKALSVPNTGMAVTIDAGEWNDIHPLNKKDVGERLAIAAENVAYGEKNIVASGPIYQSALVKGSRIAISFKNTGSGLVKHDGTELEQFAIAGADKKFVWATAIIEGDKVIVWNEKVINPLYVRYAWADNPEGANLYNKEGLPASPFRTDNP